MKNKHRQEKSCHNWEGYISLAQWGAMDSPTKYEIIPYKSYRGIKKIKVVRKHEK